MLILFSKTDALGDQLWATGLVAKLLEARPTARLIWLVRSGYEAVHDLLPGAKVSHVNDTLPPKAEAHRLLSSSVGDGEVPWARVTFVPISLNAYAPHPAERDLETDTAWWIDLARALQPEWSIAGTVTLNWVDQMMVFASGAPVRVGYNRCIDAQTLPDAVTSTFVSWGIEPTFTCTLEKVTARHEGENLAALARPLLGDLGYPEIRLGYTLPTPSSRRKATCTVTLAPGTGDPLRIYPPDKLAAAIAKFSRGMNPRPELCILQGPNDAAICIELAAELLQQGLIVPIIETPGNQLETALQLLGQTDLLVCNESFWVHLASALGIPTVAIWGGGHWGRFTPRQGRTTVLYTPMLCQNCNWRCCFSSRLCIRDIPVSFVTDALQKRVADPSACGVELYAASPALSDSTIREAIYDQLRKAESVVNERNLLQAQLADLQSNFTAVEKDRSDRGQLIEAQGKKLTKLEGEFDIRLKELKALYASADDLKNERNLLQAQLADLQSNFTAVEKDRSDRGQLIEAQGKKLTKLEGEFDIRLKELKALYASADDLKNERNLLQAQLADLQSNFTAVEKDRSDRGQLIEAQGKKLTKLEGEFDIRLKELKALYASADDLKNERNLLQAQLADLQSNFTAVEKDRSDRGQLIEAQGKKLTKLEGEFDIRLKELKALYASADDLKNERNLLQAQLADLQSNFTAVEKDRSDRGQLIEAQGKKLTKLEGEFDIRLKELKALYASADDLKNERNLLQAQLADLQSNFTAVEKDRSDRGQLIEAQGKKLTKLEVEFDIRLKELKALYASADDLKNERNLLQAQLADLQSNFTAVEKDRSDRGQLIETLGQRIMELEKAVWLTEQNRDYWKSRSEQS
jgi:ADP-heptose:LPS heptosyltransferase/predicted  nucleic acid-binding Zn-ribbon protein